MGLKMNGFGLMYNDKNTSSLGKDFEVNIQTSNAGGKNHRVKCTFCGRENIISLALIKQRLEIDIKNLKEKLKNPELTDEDKLMMIQKGSILSFRCGSCNMPVSTTIGKKEIDIYEVPEYQKEIQSFVDTIEGRAKRGQVSYVSKQKYNEDRGRE